MANIIIVKEDHFAWNRVQLNDQGTWILQQHRSFHCYDLRPDSNVSVILCTICCRKLRIAKTGMCVWSTLVEGPMGKPLRSVNDRFNLMFFLLTFISTSLVPYPELRGGRSIVGGSIDNILSVWRRADFTSKKCPKSPTSRPGWL